MIEPFDSPKLKTRIYTRQSHYARLKTVQPFERFGNLHRRITQLRSSSMSNAFDFAPEFQICRTRTRLDRADRSDVA
jgi:hypothetical protein